MTQDITTTEAAQKCLKIVDMCMNFLRTTGGDSNQTLFDYATKVLLLEPDHLRQVWISNVLFRVQLKQVLGLFEVSIQTLQINFSRFSQVL